MRAAFPAAAAAFLLLAGGCGGGQPKFENFDKTQAQQKEDFAECDWEASKATAGLADSGERKDRVSELVEKCMKAKGYTSK